MPAFRAVFPNRPNDPPLPAASFNLLLIPMGFPMPATALVNRAWKDLSQVVFGAQPRQPHLAVYTPRLGSAGQPDLPDLGLALGTDGRLSIPAANANALVEYITRSTVTDKEGEDWPALKLWPRFGKAGVGMGNLVALLVNGTAGSPGELYEMEGSDRYPIPVVGAVVDGSPNWVNVIARGFAQKFASLFDEFELSGADFSVPPDPYFPRAPNLFFTDAATRNALEAIASGQSQDSLQVVAAEAAEAWRMSFPAGSKPVMRQDDATNPPITQAQRSDTTPLLYEGGGLYRHNVFRANRDCLMRRIPLTTATATRPDYMAVQADAQFCYVCAGILNGQLGEASEVLARPPLTLANQRLEYDRVAWRSREKRPGTPEALEKTNIGRRAPFWSFKVLMGADDFALQVKDVKHSGRKDVLFRAIADVMRSVRYRITSVTMSDGTTVTLPVSEALSNRQQPVVFEIASDGGAAHEYDFGCKLTMSWPRSGWIMQVSQSLVLKAANNDIDPGHAVTACKIYPQMSFRYFADPSATSTAKRPAVKSFSGSIVCDMDHAIPTSAASQLAPFELDDLASGRLAMAMFVDSNTSDYDNLYDFDPAFIADVGAQSFGRLIAEAPAFMLLDGVFKDGRKLTRVVNTGASPATWPGAAARYQYLFRSSVPVLPAWSWVFDCVRPDSATDFSIVGVYCPTDPADGTKGQMFRRALYKWPPAGTYEGPNNYQMTINKFPRQGYYDNLHIHPTEATPHFTEAPFCADVCMHFHWRWGVLAGAGPDPYSFLGWGNGKRGRGGHTTLGGPLIPPNQHLDVDITRSTPGAIGVTYRVRVMEPLPNQTQVLFEQGVGFAFSYEGILRPIDIVRFATGMGVVGLTFTLELIRLNQERRTSPDLYDAHVRTLFHEIYEALQYYDKSVDKMTADRVQQIPDGRDADPSQPGSLPPEQL
jgi:hypothetical protein